MERGELGWLGSCGGGDLSELPVGFGEFGGCGEGGEGFLGELGCGEGGSAGYCCWCVGLRRG